jgi:hypothetical protein
MNLSFCRYVEMYNTNQIQTMCRKTEISLIKLAQVTFARLDTIGPWSHDPVGSGRIRQSDQGGLISNDVISRSDLDQQRISLAFPQVPIPSPKRYSVHRHRQLTGHLTVIDWHLMAVTRPASEHTTVVSRGLATEQAVKTPCSDPAPLSYFRTPTRMLQMPIITLNITQSITLMSLC